MGADYKYENNPVIWPSEHWEVTGSYTDYGYGHVRRTDDGLFRWTYQASNVAGHVSDDIATSVSGYCYARSRDGLRWEKPSLGMVTFRDAAETNIIRASGFNSAWYNPARDVYQGIIRRSEMEKTPPYTWAEDWMELCESEDGVHWPDEGTGETFCESKLDCQTAPLYIDEEDGTGAFISRGGPPPGRNEDGVLRSHTGEYDGDPEGGDTNRRMYRWEFDGTRMHSPEHILDAPEYPDTQIYYMVTAEVENRYYGFAAVINQPVGAVNDDPVPEDDDWYDTVDCYLAVSDDGYDWEWAQDEPIIPRGDLGQFDYRCIYPHQPPVRVEDELWVYYNGLDARHGDEDRGIPRHSALGLARIPVGELPR